MKTGEAFLRLSYMQVATAAALLVVSGVLSALLQLQLVRKTFVAAARMVIQLLLAGLLLQWVFTHPHWSVVLAVMLTMSLIAGLAAVERSSRRHPGIWLHGVAPIFTSAWLMIIIALLWILPVQPWCSPQYAIPLMGMVLGNSLTGVSLALDRLGAELTAHRDRLEGLLAPGATRKEAAAPFVRTAVAAGMIPTINVMVVAGIVTLAGTMTGQMLAGVNPVDAAKYQIVIMFLLVCATTLGTAAAVLLSTRRLFNQRDQFQYWLIRRREQNRLSGILAP